MTGAYIRVEREGKFLNVEVEYLTDEERIELFTARPPEQLVNWLNLVCNVLEEVQ